MSTLSDTHKRRTGRSDCTGPIPCLPRPTALTLAEAAEFLQLDEKTIRKFANAGQIPCRRIGKNFRFSELALHHWLAGPDDCPVQPSAQDAPIAPIATQGMEQ